MIRERKNCHLLLLPGSEPSRGTARLVPPRRPGAAVAPRSLHFLVSSRQMIELSRSRDTALFQRDLELPWRERFPTPDREHSKHAYENRGVPSRSQRDAFSFSCLPPALAPRNGSNQKKGQAQGRGSQHPKIRSPAPPQQGWGDKRRGAEKGAPASKELQQRRAGGAAAGTRATPRSPWVSGWQVQDGEKTKNKTERNKKNKTQQKQTEPQRNATRQPQAGGPSREEGGGAGSPTRSTAFGSFLPPRYLAILIPLWKFSQDISFPSRSPPREPWTGNFF